uniref:Uncharacterized protein n=1 Tax=Arundo donax TaxID=35708 RepID=A0A0A8ZQP7_ARUDO
MIDRTQPRCGVQFETKRARGLMITSHYCVLQPLETNKSLSVWLRTPIFSFPRILLAVVIYIGFKC